MKKLVLFSILAVCFLGGCVTTAGSSDVRGESMRPNWVVSYPDDPAYFVGIGSSNTGNLSNDSETARSKALSNLAASIAVQVKGEINVEYQEDSQGKLFSAVEQKIQENVNQNLTGVETVATWNSPLDGSWVYVRLDIVEWERQKETAKQSIRDRTAAIIAPVWGTHSGSLAQRLAALWAAREIVAESPYMGTISSDLFGRKGILIDLIETELQELLHNTSFLLQNNIIQMEIGRPLELQVVVKNTVTSQIGSLPIVITPMETVHGFSTLNLVSDESGFYNGILSLPAVETGKVNYQVKMDLENLGIRTNELFQKIVIPSADFLLDIQPLTAQFVLLMDDGSVTDPYRNRVMSLFSDILPVKLAETSDDYSIQCVLKFYRYPETQYTKNMIIMDTYASVSIIKDGKTLVSRETPKYKDGGLDLDQAKEKSLDKFLKSLRSDEEFRLELTKAFSLD